MFLEKHQASFSATENNETFGVKKMTSGAKRINSSLTMCAFEGTNAAYFTIRGPFLFFISQ
jgi:hypothetical protein